MRAWLTTFVALASAALCAGAEEPAAWWRELPAEAVFELNVGEFELAPPPSCRVVGGPFKPVEDRWGSRVVPPPLPQAPGPREGKPLRALEAERGARLCVGGPDWERYAVAAEVMLGSGRLLTLGVATADGEDGKPGYQLELRASKGDKFKVDASASCRDGDVVTRTVRGKKVKSWLRLGMRPDLRGLAYSYSEEASKAALKKLQAEFGATTGWDERWFRLRVELAPLQVRLWADGQLVASVDRPKWTRGGVCLSLNAGDRVRLLRVERLPREADGFVPLDLVARFNGEGCELPDGRVPPPGRFVDVGGVPFHWGGAPGRPNHLDLSKVAFRGRHGYIRCEATGNDPKRILLRVPRRQYRQIALLAAAAARPGATSALNVRMVKPVRGLVLDRCQPVPHWGDTKDESGALPLPVGEKGNLWLVRIPLDPGAFQDFLASEEETGLELDLTRPPVRPGYPEIVAQPSGVRVFAATLVESPVEMAVGSEEFGHIFVQPQVPAFAMRLRNTTLRPSSGTIEARVTDFYGAGKVHRVSYRLAPGQSTTVAMKLPVDVLGLHYLDVRLLDEGGEALIRRQTTFALLPPDTRQADHDSPFGMWVFMDGHYGAGAEAAGSLLSKIGVRWSHVAKELWEQGFSKRWKIHPAYASLLWQVTSPEQALEKIKQNPHQEWWTVFAETALGERHFHYFPPELLEKPAPKKLTDEEEKRFQELWKLAISCSSAAREKHPNLKLSFGNGYPQFIATFLSRGYPRKLFDCLGLDFMGDRMQMFFYLKEVARHYGCGDVPLDITEGFYVCSGCGYYPDRELEREQGDVYVRGFLRGLAMGVERFGAACEVWDPGSDYYYTGYGSVGLCHMGPELNPKPGYCAYGTMTRLLDKAKFHSLVPTGSVNAHLLRFDGPNGQVYAAWTTQGRRTIGFKVAGGAKPRLIDGMGNPRPLTVADGRASFEIDPAPLWVQDAGAIGDVQLGTPAYDTAPAADAALVVAGAGLGEWALDASPRPELQALDHETPVKPCAFALGVAEGRAGDAKALAVTLGEEPGVSPHRLRYATLRPKGEAPAIPAGTSQLGIWLLGNGAAWVDLELTDAKGERWHTIRRPRSYIFGMPYAGPCAFDGWRYVPWPLPVPGQAESQPWAAWRHEKGDGVLDLPARLTGLVLEQAGKVVHINQLVPATSPTWRIGGVLGEPARPAPR